MKLFIKRFFPFLLTFGAGLLVASFFVTVSAPQFNFGKRNEWRHKKYCKKENERLRRENERLKRELAEREAINSSDEIMLLDVPPLPPMPPAPPKAPIAPRN